MKYMLIAVFLLVAIAGKGQIKRTDTVSGSWSFSKSYYLGDNHWIDKTEYSDKPGLFIELNGYDSLQAIKKLMLMSDSLDARVWKLDSLQQVVLDALLNAIEHPDKKGIWQKAHLARQRYFEFLYPYKTFNKK